jgi:signal recognition particle subunit SRP54
MFETLTQRINQALKSLRGRGILSEGDVDVALREVRLALLEADVHFGVVKTFVSRVRERAIGAAVSRALNPAQQVIKVVNEELIALLGEPAGLQLSGDRPRVVMLVGLQGAGKTTAAAKLARLLRSKGERVMLAACDPYRPAAVEQLRQLAAQIDVPVDSDPDLSPVELARRALDKSQKGGFGVLILDTAGRSQLDQEMMTELRALSAAVNAVESLLVLDSMTGQEALNIASGFRDHVDITGLILTKMDGDARGGAAISVRSVTGVPIKFLGTGEKLDALEAFEPSRLAARILGMGDVVGLIEKAELALDLQDGQHGVKKLMHGQFTLEDWLEQMSQIKKMGPLGQVMEMLPGQLGQFARQADPRELERSFRVSEAIVRSMTGQERRNPDVLNASRRRRIAAGAGTDVQEVNRLLKQFRQTQKLMKSLGRDGGRGLKGLLG